MGGVQHRRQSARISVTAHPYDDDRSQRDLDRRGILAGQHKWGRRLVLHDSSTNAGIASGDGAEPITASRKRARQPTPVAD
jgi:hypothetical protein